MHLQPSCNRASDGWMDGWMDGVLMDGEIPILVLWVGLEKKQSKC